MSARIVPFEDKYLSEVKEIFFESSTRKEFKDQNEKDSFFYKYVGYYLKHFPELAFVAVENKVLGYIVASPLSHESELDSIQPHLKIFAKEFTEFPAHLHINCHYESRGKGVGVQLVEALEKTLVQRKIRGLHIVTGADARNAHFYKKLGFLHESMEDFQGSRLLLMGKRLGGE